MVNEWHMNTLHVVPGPKENVTEFVHMYSRHYEAYKQTAAALV